MDFKSMFFDGKCMFWGGFMSIVEFFLFLFEF